MTAPKCPTFPVTAGSPVKLQVMPWGAKQESAGVFYFQSLFCKPWYFIKELSIVLEHWLSWWLAAFALPSILVLYLHNCFPFLCVWGSFERQQDVVNSSHGHEMAWGACKRRHWAVLKATYPAEPKNGRTEFQGLRVAYTPRLWFVFTDCFVVLLFFHEKAITVYHLSVSFDWEKKLCEIEETTPWYFLGRSLLPWSSKLCIICIGNSTFSKQNIGKCVFSFNCLIVLARHSLQCAKCRDVCSDIESGKLIMQFYRKRTH